MAKIAINGLGRVGRQVLKHLITRYPELEIVAANDITDEQTLAHLLKYDSNYGTWDINIEGKEGAIVIGDREVKIFREKDPAALPWGTLGIDIVIESTGVFTDADKARAAHNRWRQESPDHRSCEGRGHYDRPGRQRGPSGCIQAHHHLQCLLHDELAGSCGQSAQ